MKRIASIALAGARRRQGEADSDSSQTPIGRGDSSQVPDSALSGVIRVTRQAG